MDCFNSMLPGLTLPSKTESIKKSKNQIRYKHSFEYQGCNFNTKQNIKCWHLQYSSKHHFRNKIYSIHLTLNFDKHKIAYEASTLVTDVPPLKILPHSSSDTLSVSSQLQQDKLCQPQHCCLQKEKNSHCYIVSQVIT